MIFLFFLSFFLSYLFIYFFNYKIANPCASRPCLNGGTCSQVGNSNNFVCNCPAPFFGKYCQNSIILWFNLFFIHFFSFSNFIFLSFKENQPCASNPCQNGGTCIPEGNGFRCECRGGFTGPRCQAGIISFFLSLNCYSFFFFFFSCDYFLILFY